MRMRDDTNKNRREYSWRQRVYNSGNHAVELAGMNAWGKNTTTTDRISRVLKLYLSVCPTSFAFKLTFFFLHLLEKRLKAWPLATLLQKVTSLINTRMLLTRLNPLEISEMRSTAFAYVFYDYQRIFRSHKRAFLPFHIGKQTLASIFDGVLLTEYRKYVLITSWISTLKHFIPPIWQKELKSSGTVGFLAYIRKNFEPLRCSKSKNKRFGWIASTV